MDEEGGGGGRGTRLLYWLIESQPNVATKVMIILFVPAQVWQSMTMYFPVSM